MFYYKGTHINGTDRTAKPYKGSGVDIKNPYAKGWAYSGDIYTNTKSGHVYVCTSEGYDHNTSRYWAAKWRYDHTNIIGIPTGKVTSLATPKRTSYEVKSTWKVPSSLTDSTDGRRAQKLRISHRVTFADNSAGKKAVTARYAQDAEINTTSATANLNGFKAKKVGKKRIKGGKTYKRSDFYPVEKNRFLQSYECFVYSGNSKSGKKGFGASASAALKFALPDPPTISQPEMNENTGTVTFTVTPAASTNTKERYDTSYQVDVYDSRTKKTVKAQGSSTTTNSAFDVSYDVTDRMQLGYDDYVKVTVTAWSRGYKGDSKKATEEIVVGWPALPTIDKVDVPSPEDGSSKVTITFNTSSRYQRIKKKKKKSKRTGLSKYTYVYDEVHPVDGVKLMALIGTTAETPAAAKLASGWDDVGPADDGDCTALATTVAVLKEDMEPGTRTWVKVRAWNDDEDNVYRDSEPWHVIQLDEPVPVVPTAADDHVYILEAVGGSDGASASVWLGWDLDGSDDSTHTELSWAKNEKAWRSTAQPKTFDIDDATWDEGQVSRGGTTYRKSAHVEIEDLEVGQTYYICARRWMDTENGQSYGDYCTKEKVTPSLAPSSAVLSAPPYIPHGSAARFSWAYDSIAEQESWRLMRQRGQTKGSSDDVVASGEGPITSATVEWSRLESVFASGQALVYIAVKAGGAEVESEAVACRVEEQPTLAASVPTTLTAQPLSITLESNQPESRVAVVVTADGVSGGGPDGGIDQPAGAAVWTVELLPQWVYDSSAQVYRATVEAPADREFVDLAAYSIELQARNPRTRLQSPSVHAAFGVAWAHQAVMPSEDVEVVPYDETDDDGKRIIGARVLLDGLYEYELSEDEEADPTKAYFAVEVSYRLTLDETVEEGKQYYTRSGEGTQQDPYVYEAVEEPVQENLPTYYETSSGYVRVMPSAGDSPSELGWSEREVTVPEGAAESDMYDVYRVTPDSVDLIASGLDLDAEVNDPYAPYGAAQLRYRVCLRTADGDQEWRDFDYVSDIDVARFDWNGRYVELAYGLSGKRSYQKSDEVSVHMDGTTALGSNPGALKVGNISGVIIEVSSYEDTELMNDLGQYPGPALVRLPNGECYLARVHVPSVQWRKVSPTVNVEIETTRIDLTDEYRARGGDLL